MSKECKHNGMRYVDRENPKHWICVCGKEFFELEPEGIEESDSDFDCRCEMCKKGNWT